MQDDALTQPLPLPRPRRIWRAVALTALPAFALGGAAVGWLVRNGQLPYALPPITQPAARLGATPERAAEPAARGLTAADAAPLGGLETRLALLEDRLSRIDGETRAVSGNAARAEALLVAFAARRRIEQGHPLGYVEDQLKLRFAGAQPEAVDRLIAAAKTPVTLDDLDAQLDAAAPVLTGDLREESTWARVQRELASLFVVRRAPMPATGPQQRIARARLMLASGKIEDAITEIDHLPGADQAQAWIASARRYGEAQRALEVIETTAMLEPRRLQDASGQPVVQGSPLAPPADEAPAP